MEQNKYQVISIILAFKAINQLHRRIGCLLSETLIFCCHYQYTKEGKMQAFAHYWISWSCYFSSPRTSLTIRIIPKKNNLANPTLPPTIQELIRASLCVLYHLWLIEKSNHNTWLSFSWGNYDNSFICAISSAFITFLSLLCPNSTMFIVSGEWQL